MHHSVLSKLERLKEYQPQTLPTGDSREAAVLIPFIRNQNQLVYTMRAGHLKKHPSQISFPGGGIDPGESPYEAALREAWEEIGLPPGSVQRLGEIDHAYSPRGYHIRCFVGLCEPFQAQIDANEVAALVEADLSELFDETLHRREAWQDRKDVHYFDFKNGQVWGVTGYITWRLREILKAL